jgi:surfeit locus 1 family protein
MASKLLTFGKLQIRCNWIVALCILLTVGGFVRLGVWQLARAQEKVAQQQDYLESGELQATPIEEVPVAGLEFDALQHQNRRVLLRGEFRNDRSIFLIYQTFEDQIGYEIVTPLQLAALDQIVLVSRGWSGISDVGDLAASLPVLSGPVEVEAQLHVPTVKEAARTNAIEDVKWPLVIRYLNTTELAPYFEAPLFPYVARLAEGQPGVLVRHWPTVAVDSGRNFSYALQWFAMAIAVVLVSLILSSNLLQLLRGKN